MDMQERQHDNRSKAIRRASRRQRGIAALIACGLIGLFGGLWLLQRVGFDFGLIFPPCGLQDADRADVPDLRDDDGRPGLRPGRRS